MAESKRIEDSKEQVEPTSEEQVKPTSEETKDLPSEKTYSQEEYSKAQSAWTKQATEANTKATEADAKATATATRLQAIEEELASSTLRRREAEDDRDAASTDPEAAKIASKRLREAEDEWSKINKATAKLEQDRTEMYGIARQGRAVELNREYGVPIEDVLTAQNDEGMVNKALMYKLAKVQEVTKVEPDEEAPQPDDSISSGSATSFDKVQQRYINGEVSREVYEKAAGEAGKNI